ncbi:MAG TPA: type II secretion system ATPase GspE [Oligoflexia bacterium]|nr:type II secretion system ATPase GspE [Oligoflexia bacterium]HMR25559.1 type II secretion system ATPase GspE [Oligoflexia bacterium]
MMKDERTKANKITVASDSEATEIWQAPQLTNKASEEQEFTAPTDISFLGMSLGEILTQTTSMDPQQLAEALSQGKNEDALVEFLLKKKWITPAQLMQARSLQLNIPLISPDKLKDLDSQLIADIPINFAKKFTLVPIEKTAFAYTIAIFSPKSMEALEDLKLLLQADIHPVLAWKDDIVGAINSIYNQATRADNNINQDLIDDIEGQNLAQMNLSETEDLLDSEDDAPIIRLVNALLFQGVKDGASDIHIEPGEKDVSVRFRIDGVLNEIMRPPRKAHNAISSRVKIMADLDIAERRIPQDGRIKIKIGGRDVDIRVSTLPTSFGERIVMRLLDTSNVLLNIEDLGFTKQQLDIINRVVHLSHGIFLVTGPTGSGKSTTLYSCLSRINTPGRNIITVEDPVEIQLAGISQIQVNEKVDLTFAAGLRSILRQDPDVVMIGEIRDKETAEIAIKASMTGHMVFSTLHTNDASTTVTRLKDMGVDTFKIADALEAVMAQRLARKLCKECKEPYTPSAIELKQLNVTQEQIQGKTIYQAKGCAKCGQTGYKGRTGIHEILPIDDHIQPLILSGADGNTIKKTAVEHGMLTLREDGALKVLDGTTSVDEILRVTQDEIGFDD